MKYLRAIHARGLFNNAGISIEMPSHAEVELMRDIISLLQPIKAIVTLFEGQSYYTLPHVPAVVFQLFNICREPEREAVDMNHFRVALRAKFEERLGKYVTDATQPALIAAVLWPSWGSTRLIDLGVAPATVSDVVHRSIPLWLQSANCIVVDESYAEAAAVNMHPAVAAMMPQSRSVAEQVEDHVNSVRQMLGDKLGPAQVDWAFSVASFTKSTTMMQNFYETLPTTPPHAALKRLARLIFAISPTTASAEQYLSGAGLIDGRLDPITLERLVVAHGFLARKSKEENFDFKKFEQTVYDNIATAIDDLSSE